MQKSVLTEQEDKVLKWCNASAITVEYELAVFEKYKAILESYPRAEHMTIQQVPPSITEHINTLRSLLKKIDIPR